MKSEKMTLIAKFLAIKKTADLFKIIIGYLIIIFFALLPLIIAIVGGYFEGIIKGHPVNEGNSGIVSFGWLAMLTIPGGFVLLILYTKLYAKNVMLFMKNRKKEH
ncbi:MAG: hypothetical protein KA734_07550 [Fluviicola sp.]|nr:hypothetical protein [Fluviicola sp.]